MNILPTILLSWRAVKHLVTTGALILALVCSTHASAEDEATIGKTKQSAALIAGATLGGTVRTITVAPNGEVYAGGHFKNGAGNPDIDFIARWNGSTWQPLGKGLASRTSSGYEGVYAIAFDGAKMYVGGVFNSTGDGVQLNNFARWDINTKTWEQLTYPCAQGTCGPGLKTGYVYALAKPLSGSGMFVGGDFDAPFSTAESTKRVALYDGAAWSALEGIDYGAVFALYVDPLSGQLYAGGRGVYLLPEFAFTTLARWDGLAWQEIQNAPEGFGNNYVTAITGTPEGIYIGGSFDIPVGRTGTGDVIYASNIAKWDGANWSRLGPVTPVGGSSPSVFALGLSGSNLYVGGSFTDPRTGGLSHRFACWDGTSWKNTGAYLSPSGGFVNTIAVSGDDVYLGGSFSNAGLIPDADYAARYNGTSWSALSNPPPSPPVVRALGASGRLGTRIRLRYRVLYLGPSAAATMWVLKNGRLVRRIKGGFAPRRPGVTYYLPFNSVGLKRGLYRYCVEAVDNYGRKSNKSCAALAIR